MLRVIQSQSAVGAKSYYSKASYYGEGQELGGTWHGKLAKSLGLDGAIKQEEFDSMCDNLRPATGERLSARNSKNRSVGYDFNFHAPKGVSLAYAFGDTQIATVFDRVVEETMKYVEGDAQTRVRIGGVQENRMTSNLAWGQFIHTTARPVDGEPDPHLHAHCFVFNATLDPVENRIKAAQFRELKRDAGYYEAIFHSKLAKAMREELGYDIRREGRGWDVDLSPTLKRKFSRRTQEIETTAAQLGLTPEEKAELGAKTRQGKVAEPSFSTLVESWRDRLSTEDKAELIRVMSSAAGSQGEAGKRSMGQWINSGPTTVKEAVRLGIQHAFERDAIVPERKVLADALRFGGGIATLEEVVAEASNQRLITRNMDGRSLATTAEVLADEQAALEFARAGKGSCTPLNAGYEIPDTWLSEEQQRAIRELTQSKDRVQLLLGGAGTGKTTLMTAAVKAMEAGGHRVFTFAPSAEASRGVLRQEGFQDATTVAELLINENLWDPLRGNVIWIDEAGLLGSRALKHVFDLAGRLDARVILSGDWQRQHGSVDRGGVMGLLDRYAGLTPIEIETIRRQSGTYRDAIAHLAAGNVSAGFDKLDRLGWISEIADDQRDQRLAEDYVKLATRHESALVISPTHAEARHITQAIRQSLKDHGVIQCDDREILSLVPRHLSEAERSMSAYLEQGDVIVFHQNAKGFRKGSRIIVDGELPKEATEQARHYSVYRPETIPLAPGDVIRISAGGKSKDGQHRLNTGARFEVQDINQRGDIRLTNGWTIDGRWGHIAQGFVSTSHAAQGQTVDHVLIAVAAESYPAAGKEQFYVSASRGRKSARIYTDDKAALRNVSHASSLKASATETLWPGDDYQRRVELQRKANRPNVSARKETTSTKRHDTKPERRIDHVQLQ